MDSDVVVQILIDIAVFTGGAVAVGVVATWLVGKVSRRAGLSNGFALLAQVLTPVTLFYLGSMYLDVAGIVVEAQVTSTEERISYRPRTPGAWSRSFWAAVTFTAPDGPAMAPLWIDEGRYDALRPGATVAVRYLPLLSFIARPADQSTRALVPWRWLAIAAGVAACAGILWLGLRRASPVLKGLTVLAAIVFGVIWIRFPTPWPPPIEPPVRTATAEVRSVRTVTHSFLSGGSTGTVAAPQPWEVVELQFVPEGRDKPVIAVDGVDVGSVAGLEVGARLPVSYSANRPRDARLVGARTYRWREWRELGEHAATGVVVIGGLLALGTLAGAWWRRSVRRSK
jgi:hypothetical protein